MCVRSEGDGNSGGDGMVAYYESEFDVHVLQQDALDEAIESLEPAGGQARHGGILKPTDALNVNNVISRGLNPHPTQGYCVHDISRVCPPAPTFTLLLHLENGTPSYCRMFSVQHKTTG